MLGYHPELKRRLRKHGTRATAEVLEAERAT